MSKYALEERDQRKVSLHKLEDVVKKECKYEAGELEFNKASETIIKREGML